MPYQYNNLPTHTTKLLKPTLIAIIGVAAAVLLQSCATNTYDNVAKVRNAYLNAQLKETKKEINGKETLLQRKQPLCPPAYTLISPKGMVVRQTCTQPLAHIPTDTVICVSALCPIAPTDITKQHNKGIPFVIIEPFVPAGKAQIPSYIRENITKAEPIQARNALVPKTPNLYMKTVKPTANSYAKDSIRIKYHDYLTTYQDTLLQMNPVYLTNGISTQYASTINFDLRKPNFIIIHHTAQDSLAQTIKTFQLNRLKVSAHYVVSRNGAVIHMLNDYLRAWHAGNGSWGKNTDLNSSSIGIELDNNGEEPFAKEQILSLVSLLDNLTKKYKIPPQNIIGHADISPGRKKDPSRYFPWKLLAAHGFGLWQDDILETPPANFNPQQALQAIGYSTRNIDNAILSFKLHYVQTEVDTKLDPETIKIIYSIYKKCL